jgi:4-hydroxy-tetrahydrodipicolinate reductase
VIGTTGLSADDGKAIAAAAAKTAIVRSGNMSMGVILLSVLVEQAARALEAADWDIEVLEMHHRHKVDAPSGTALLLGEAAAKGRGIGLEDNSVRVRDGHTGAREAGSIGFATLRGGSVVGDHSVILAGPGERVTLSHHAEDRMIFARGAVKAALWAKGRAPGLYSMHDVLGLARLAQTNSTEGVIHVRHHGSCPSRPERVEQAQSFHRLEGSRPDRARHPRKPSRAPGR